MTKGAFLVEVEDSEKFLRTFLTFASCRNHLISVDLGHRWYVVRKGPWKLIKSKDWLRRNYQPEEKGIAKSAPDYEYPGDMVLFHLKEDIGETTDVAAKHPKIAKELTALYHKLRLQMRTREAEKKMKKQVTQPLTSL
jgi:hypothetical protein